MNSHISAPHYYTLREMYHDPEFEIQRDKQFNQIAKEIGLEEMEFKSYNQAAVFVCAKMGVSPETVLEYIPSVDSVEEVNFISQQALSYTN